MGCVSCVRNTLLVRFQIQEGKSYKWFSRFAITLTRMCKALQMPVLLPCNDLHVVRR